MEFIEKRVHDLYWKDDIIQTCYEYAESFQQEFGSLRCYELRPEGFTPNDPPHMCEALTCKAIEFAYHFIKEEN